MHARRRALGRQEGQQARLGPRLQAATALPVMLGLGGCTAGSVDLTTASLGLALLLIAPLAYGLGVLRERQRLEKQLRESRAETRALLELRHDGWWQTDAQHQLISWQAPGGAASGPNGGDCLLFAPGDPERDAVLLSSALGRTGDEPHSGHGGDGSGPRESATSHRILASVHCRRAVLAAI